MDLRDLTGANSTATMLVPLMPNPVNLEQFSIDSSIVASAPTMTNSAFTLTGQKLDSLSYEEMTININFAATSPSIAVFTSWRDMMYLTKSALNGGVLSVSINAIAKRYIFKNCALRSTPVMPALSSQLGNVEIVLSCHPLPDVIDL